MGRKKYDAVHRYFSYDPKTQISKCELCGRDLKGCHSSNLKNHMLAHHPEDLAVVKALNVNIKKDINEANNSTTSRASPKEYKTEDTVENSEDEADWLDSEFINCQNSTENNPTPSRTDDFGGDSLTQHQHSVSAPKILKNSNMSLNETKQDNMMESNKLFGQFIAAELGRYQGKERYVIMQKIMRIFMD